MSNILSSDFPIAKDQYVAFDGLTIKQKIRERLTQTGVFTDQNFEGSNISAMNDAIAMVFSYLLFYLNKTSNEGQFSESQIYENMNRIVKELDYKPIGHQTASLAYSLSAQTLSAGLYTIPRYSFIPLGGVKYTFVNDFSFSKVEDVTTETILNTGAESLLYQGTVIEYPTVIAAGNPNEIVYLTANDDTVVDNFNIDVYVKSTDGVWSQWTKTQSLYINNAYEKVYEVRFNENRRYEIKFGNNINGQQLLEDDQIAIYYLRSDGASGQVGANVLAGKRAVRFTSARFTEILNDLETYSDYLDASQMSLLLFNNGCVSTSYSEPEGVDSIRANAPGVFRSQFRLVTNGDYETYIKTNFSNIIHDVVCINNKEYLDSYIRYFYDLGLTKPQLESRALFNQMRYADSCNFNNVYLFCVPKTVANNLTYLAPAQKALIVETTREEKTLTSELIPLDPVYLAIDIALSDSNTISIEDIPFTELFIEKTAGSRRNDASIKQDVANVINNYFQRKNAALGQTIDINQLTADILGIEGIRKISTRRTDTGLTVDGVRFIIWNPIYPDFSTALIVGNTTLENFQFPYLFNTNFLDRISVDNSFSRYEGISY